ncbi:MAG: hypothetical protein HN348_21335 [Proteobacteria bacterium]|jgi:predicted  nucleic acid-binding Zn-ribbon protein|nr:hypothetical protein [Pseudomonadota bacterium]
MHPVLVILKQVGDFDAALTERQKAIDKQRALLDKLQGQVDSAGKHQLAIETTIKTNRQHEHTLNRNMAKFDSRRKSALRVLEGAGGDPEAAQRQLEQCVALIDGVETELLELLEEQDDHQQELVLAKDAVASAEQKLAETKIVAAAIIDTAEKESEKLRPERREVFETLEASVQERYSLLVRKKRYAITPIKDKSCSACHRVVPAQQISDIKRGIILPCRNCGRWLSPEPPKAA